MCVAKVISEEIRTLDTLVRYDGDEFVMMVESIEKSGRNATQGQK